MSAALQGVSDMSLLVIYYYVVLNLSITLYLCINHSNHKDTIFYGI